MLRELRGDRPAAPLALHRARVVDLGQMPFLERHVEHRADDLNDVPQVLRRCYSHSFSFRSTLTSRTRERHFASASAPDAISSISFVIRPCRALFAASV